MNKLLVVRSALQTSVFAVTEVYYRLANSRSREYIPGIVFNHIRCGVGGILVNDGRT